LRSAGYAEIQRIIREVEPPRPSARLSKSATARLGADARQADESRKLTRMVRGELDWIVMKAIEKDRTRRYETANGLAMDIRRYLASEAVLAAPPSAVYRMQKFVRRNKTVVAAGSLVAIALLVGIAGFAWQAHIAQQRADELQQVSNFQEEMLQQVDPTRAGKLLTEDVEAKFAAALDKAGVPAAERARQVAAFSAQWRRVNATDAAIHLIDRTILKPAVAAIDKQFGGQPVVDATMRQVLANRYYDMGLYDEAMPLQKSALATRRRVLGGENQATLDSIDGMGNLLEAQGNLAAAEPYFREAVATSHRVRGENDPNTLEALSYLGALLHDEGKLAEAEPYLRGVLEKRRRLLGADDPSTLVSLGDMAGLLVDQGKLGEAETCMREALAGFRKVKGEEDPDTLRAINNLGIVLSEEGKPKEAEPYLREALEKHRRLLGEEHPDTVQSLVTLGGMLLDEGKLDEAEPLLREATEKSRRVLGDDVANTWISMALLGRLLVDKGRFAEAEQLLAPSEEAARKALGETSAPQFASFLVGLGRARIGTHAFAAAQANLLEAQSISSKLPGTRQELMGKYIQALVDLYVAWNTAEPGKGYDAKAVEWKQKLEALDAPSSPAPAAPKSSSPR
jgi:tetratricopeptide (TPR) repeat protein